MTYINFKLELEKNIVIASFDEITYTKTSNNKNSFI